MEEKIRRIIEEIDPEILTYNGSNMMEDGTVDSFEVIEIVSALEDEFGMEIDASYVIAENFADLDAIVRLMEKVKEEQ